jgi:anti-anti-sigma regulatory factor
MHFKTIERRKPVPYSYALADRGSTLATRPLAKELRSDLAQHAGDQQLVVLDFSGVAAASHSFADEFVAQLAEDSREGRVPFTITICGASSEVDRIVRQALQRRDIDLPALV